MVKVLVKKLSPEVQLPTYKTSGASGMDLMACLKSTIKIEPKSSCAVISPATILYNFAISDDGRNVGR